MYEKRNEQLLSRQEFALRVLRHGGIALVSIAAALTIGIAGYHYIAGFQWIDATLNASMILGGMGPVGDALQLSHAGKLFASAYALFSGLFFIAMVGLLLAPFLHRLAHTLHMEEDDATPRE